MQRGTEFQDGQRRDKPGKVTLKSFCKNWFKTRKPQLRIATLKGYRGTIDRLYSYFGKDSLISEITSQNGKGFNHRVENGRTAI